MAFEATFRKGNPHYEDYTPTTGDVAAGQVVLIGNTTGLCLGIAPLAIANNTLGTLAVDGGSWDVTMLGNYAAGSKVYWDDTNNKLTTTSTNNALFGFIVPSSGGTGANTTARALLKPFV